MWVFELVSVRRGFLPKLCISSRKHNKHSSDVTTPRPTAAPTSNLSVNVKFVGCCNVTSHSVNRE